MVKWVLKGCVCWVIVSDDEFLCAYQMCIGLFISLTSVCPPIVSGAFSWVNSLLIFFHFELCGLRLDRCIGTVPRKQTHSKGQCATFNQLFFLDTGQKKFTTVCSQGKSCKTSQKSPCSGLSDARSSGATENRDWRYDFLLQYVLWPLDGSKSYTRYL